MSISNLEFLVKEKRRIESFVNSGQLGNARKIAEKLCRKQRNDAESWFLLGAICGQQGDFLRAVECCKKTVELAPRVAIAYLNLGVALHGAGQLAEAVQSLYKSLELQSDLTAAYQELGVIYSEMSDYSQAIYNYNQLVCIQPNDQSVWLVLGNLYEKQHDIVNAEQCYRKSFEIDTTSIAAGINLGNVLKKLDRADDTESIYKQLLQVSNNNPDVLFNLAVLYQSQYRYDEAEINYQKVIEISPSNHGAKLNLGIICMALVQYDRAIEFFSQILEDVPDNIDARRNLSSVYKELNQLESAAEQLEIIIGSFPDDLKTHQDRSLIWLQQGKFLKGWPEYEWRFRGINAIRSLWPFPSWTNNNTVNETVLVYPEQGVGDEIMFSSCVKDISECANVVLACDARLEPLFQRSFPDVKVIGRNKNDDQWLHSLPHIDAQISIASLPLHFRRQRDQFPSRDGYLTADSASMEKWRARYKKLDGKVTVGISWRGGHETNTKIKRSNDLAQWQSLFQLANVNFVNLQYGDCSSDIKLVKKLSDVTLHDWDDSDPLVDMDDFSAKIKALDLVISIDNSTVHLSGALGVPTWILQPFSPDWRWLPDDRHSYWYTSVTQYRQTVLGEWNVVINTVADDLAQLIKTIK